MRTHNSETQSTMTPEKSIQYLREGNARFVANLRAHRNLLEQVNETRDDQFPFATVLSCIDSRTSAELIFDQGLGDIFSVRVAGYIVNEDVLGSMEFSCKVAGARAIVVLGHSKCGAIKGACDGVQLGNLTTLLNKIQPAVFHERTEKDNRTAKNPLFVEKVAEIQVRRSVRAIIEQSPVLRGMVESSEIAIIGGMYDVESGIVHWLDDTHVMGSVSRLFNSEPRVELAR